MIGAIIGDIVGSPYEFDRGEKFMAAVKSLMR